MATSGNPATPSSAAMTTSSPVLSTPAQGTTSSPDVPVRRLRLKGKQPGVSFYGSTDAAQAVTLPCIAGGEGEAAAESTSAATSNRDFLRGEAIVQCVK